MSKVFEMVEIMIVDELSKFTSVSKETVICQIGDTYSNKYQNSFVNERTDINKDCHLIAYDQFCDRNIKKTEKRHHTKPYKSLLRKNRQTLF